MRAREIAAARREAGETVETDTWGRPLDLASSTVAEFGVYRAAGTAGPYFYQERHAEDYYWSVGRRRPAFAASTVVRADGPFGRIANYDDLYLDAARSGKPNRIGVA